MSDVGLEADLLLDVRQALRAVEQLNESINRATSEVRITADVRSVTAAIDAAIENANVGLTIVANAKDVTGEIDAAIENADTAVTVTASAAPVTGAINAAVENADTEVTVTADTAPAVASVAALDSGLIAAGGSASNLRQILSVAAFAATAKGLYEIAQAASAMAESTSKATVVFGDSFSQVEQFTKSAATSIGQSRQEALEAAGTFGNLFNALGLTKKASADLAPQVLQLGADLASFNNLGVDDTLEKIRSGLVGEIEPLRSLGISFLDVNVRAKAAELGLVGVNGELTEGAKVQARWALIVEQSKNSAGDFARTSEGLANQQRILTAEFKNVIIEAGEHLLPAFLDLVKLAREDLVPTLGELADKALPAVADILTSVAPLFGVTLDILVALAPVLETIATLIGAIPTPLLAVAGAAFAVNRALNFARGLKSVQALTGGLTKVTEVLAGFGAGGPLLGKIALGLGAVALVAATTEGGLDGLNASLDRLVDSFTGLDRVGKREAKILGEIQKLTGSLDLTDLDQASIAIGLLNDELERAERNERGTIPDPGGGGTKSKEAKERVKQIREQIAVLEEQAKGELVAGLSTHKWTIAQIEAAAAAARRAGDESTVIGTLDRLQEADAAAAVEAQKVIDRYADLSSIIGVAEDAIQDFVDTAVGQLPTFADAFAESLQESADAASRHAKSISDAGSERADAIRDASTDEAKAIKDAADLRADAIREAADAEADLIEKAARSGKNESTKDAELERAKQIRESATKAVAAEKDAAERQAAAIVEGGQVRAEAVRDAAAAQADAQDVAGKVTAAALTQNLNEQAGEIAAFQIRLKAISDAGFADLAGLIAQQGPELGGALAQELADALQTGNVKVLEQLRAANDNFNKQFSTTTDFLRDELGPKFIRTAALIGAGASAEFGKNLTFAERIRISMGVDALAEIDEQGKAVATVAAVEGAEAARLYGEALNLDDHVIDQMVAAGKAIKDGNQDLIAAAQQAGADIGSAIGLGVAFGVSTAGQTMSREALAKLVADAVEAGKLLIEAGSPSRLFARVMGVPIGQGIAAGIDQAAAGTPDAIARLVAAAVSVPIPRMTVQPSIGTSVTRSADELSIASRGHTEASRGDRKGIVVQGPLIGTMETPDPKESAVDVGRGLESIAYRLDLGS